MKLTLVFCLMSMQMTILAQSIYLPPSGSNVWDTLSPSRLNWCNDKINELYTYLLQEQTKSFLLLKDGKIVLEKYFGSYTRDSSWFWFSAGKSLTATLIGIAQENGKLDINQKVSTYLGPGWTSLPLEKENLITVWNQLTMTTGLNELAFYCITPNCLLYKADAGTRWAYHNGPYSLTKDVLEKVTGQSLNIFTTLQIKNKIGMGSGIWLPSGNNHYFYSTARDMARYGILMQNKMVWSNNTVVLKDTSFYRKMITSSQNLNPSYGLLWWLNGKESFIAPGNPASIKGPLGPHAPADVFVAGGAMGQFISVSPGSGLIMIRQGSSTSEDLAALEMHDRIWEKIMKLNCATTPVHSIRMNKIRIYPNPTKEFIHIDGLSGENIDLRITDIQGHTLKVLSNQSVMDISELKKGVYFVSITNKNNQVESVEKIVLQ